ncbi:MAG: biphenyl-2,3-diol 1,2-dioxygenase [Candidatus Binataceae bacterium]
MSGIRSLGYVGLGVKDLTAWERFATQVLGLQSAGDRGDGVLRLRMDEYAYRFALHRDDADDLAYAGWEVADAAGLRDTAERLRAAGVAVETGSAEHTAARGVAELIRFSDPNGIACEAFYGPSVEFEKPFHSPRAISGFKTGEQGAGHIVVAVKDLQQSLRFYCDVLGFRVSDFIEMKFGPARVTMGFLHCNPRHHTLALVPAPAPRRLHHFMLQTRSIDDVGATMYLVQDSGIEITSSLGRHTNDHMLSFYMRTPSGFEIEYGWGGREIDDDTWRVQKHHAPSIWGHRRSAPR